MLGVTHVVLGADDKLAPWEQLRRELGARAGACAHIGDDLPDLPVLVALRPGGDGAARARAHQEHAHYVTRADGGAGAVRELCELILAARGELESRCGRTRNDDPAALNSIASSRGRRCCCSAPSRRSRTG